jgi:muconolactone delta-isomerase
LTALPKSDLVHIAGDLSRGYSQIVVQWLAYAEHLKASYPFLYSLAVRINPLGAHPSAVVEGP